MFISQTPFRVSFFGGGTDYPAWYRENGGTVLATTIDKYCNISVRRLPPFFSHKHRIVYSFVEAVREISEIQHPSVRATLSTLGCEEGLEIHHDGDLPARSGLGSSSAFTVGLIHALWAMRSKRISKQRLAELAIHIEQDVIGEVVGSQDQVSAAYGGLNRIDFLASGEIVVTPVIMRPTKRKRLEESLVLYFTGFSRNAEKFAREKVRRLKDRASELRELAALATEGQNILENESEDVHEFGKLLDHAWRLKRSLSGTVSSSSIDSIYQAALSAGAVGGKLLGAGGGGFMLFCVPPELRGKLQEKLHGLLCVSFRLESAGSQIIVYRPDGGEEAR